MKLPSIDPSVLPDLGQLTGVFGSLSDLATVSTDDRIIAVMVFLFEAVPPENLI
ncbi:hypothetical protein [Allopontixanthobacter sp.]|uniref:hypothetical protein n=1 Tax=Allopontixanthobacter sp. TaxID=2906452 RepID=UPI002ABA3157|nr:hypothetical protein [Allopontixanthobacter sp.]MDZ4308349.1 hypothetical protein [Allopontixanthobacter sp.]